MAFYFRRRSSIHLPITLSVSLMALNVTLMICWIVILAQRARWTALTVGVVAFTLILAGLSLWLVLTLKEIALNNRQANFVDSVTHELKSPIAALRLYLETLRMRNLDAAKREEFHSIMESELHRLDALINQLLEVGRLDAIGENTDPENVDVTELLGTCAEATCAQRKKEVADVFEFRTQPIVLQARRIVLELIVSNLVDNAVKYAGDPPQVIVETSKLGTNRVRIRITNNGIGIPPEERNKIFKIFYRGGSELQRRQKGTGLGLYIVYTLVKRLRGKVTVQDRSDGNEGCTFEIELYGVVPLPPARLDSRETSDRPAA